MKTNSDTFERIEKKYLLSKKKYRLLREYMDQYMEEDAYGLSCICNIYYDTNNYELIRQSIEKPVYKEKLRVRSYGVPNDNAKVFIEIKKKYDGVVYKRRIEMKKKEADLYLWHGIRPQKQSQILNEIDYFLQYYHPVPKMYIAYDRIAMFGKEDESIRVTFDFHIRSRDYDLDLVKGDYGEELLNEEQVLMEIKVAGAYPLWMIAILSSLEIYPVTYSKYGAVYKNKAIHIDKGERKIC